MTESAIDWADDAWHDMRIIHPGVSVGALYQMCMQLSHELDRPPQWLAAARGRLYWLSTGGQPGTNPTTKPRKR